MASFNGVPVPPNGRKIEYSNGKYSVPNHPIIPFIEGDGTGRDIWKASVRVFDAAVEKAYDGKRSRGLVRSLRRRESQGRVQNLAARRHRQRHPRISRRHQRPADHARRWRHSLPQRRPASDPRSLLLHSAGEVLQGRPVAGEASRAHEHRHLPREHRRCLRGHRMGRRERPK